ncbi:MAG: hypothetical protein EPO21_18675 [Chloroflexota bacterium]|nr:MAG: hypothetical protein EPO21_18675 [Chloroflexota bacterium]
MVLLESVFLSVLIGLIAGGRLGRLGGIPLRRGYLIILAALMQSYVVYSAKAEIVSGLALPTVILLGSYIILIVACAVNLRLPGMYLVGLGLLLNLTVMTANGGYMPISAEQLQAAGFTRELSQVESYYRLPRSKDVLMPASEIRLAALSDVLVLTLPLPLDNRYTRTVMSVGDVLVAVGIFFLAQAGLGSRLALFKLQPVGRPRSQHSPSSTAT